MGDSSEISVSVDNSEAHKINSNIATGKDKVTSWSLNLLEEKRMFNKILFVKEVFVSLPTDTIYSTTLSLFFTK